MELTNIPDEIFDNIFKFLNLGDLLHLREVSKFTKSLADNYIRVYGENSKVHQIYLDTPPSVNHPSSLRSYISHLESDTLVVPTSSFHLVYNRERAFEKRDVRILADLCGNNITYLHLDFLQTPIISGQIINFLELLPNLAHLTIVRLRGRNMGIVKRQKMNEGSFALAVNEVLVPRFGHLRSLEIYSYQKPSGVLAPIVNPEYVWQIIEQCSDRLIYLAFPLFKFNGTSFVEEISTYNQQGVRSIINILQRRAQEIPLEPNLQYLDLENYRESFYGRANDDLFNLLGSCAMHGVKLLNFNAKRLKGRGRDFAHFVSQSAVSITGLTGSMFLSSFLQLEKLTVEARDFSFPLGATVLEQWLSLKDLDLTIYSQHFPYRTLAQQRLLNFFFVGVTRVNMETLRLSFIQMEPVPVNNPVVHPFPPSIVASCPNLKCIKLEGWPTDATENLHIASLWTGLSLLEFVSLVGCKNLNIEAFVGRDQQQPAFLQLKKLKHLELGRLGSMTNLTDDLLRDVIRHTPLQELRLWSHLGKNDPTVVAKSITLEGILSLKEGEFAKSIEKFKLKDYLALDNVSQSQLADVESQFRSFRF